MPSIKIIRLPDGTVAFQPDQPHSQPGQPLGVLVGDNVTWNNQTNEVHRPWPTDAQGRLLSEADAVAFGFYLSDDVPPDRPSRPIYNVNPQFSPPRTGLPDTPPPTITYVCRHHQGEGGSIVVNNP